MDGSSTENVLAVPVPHLPPEIWVKIILYIDTKSCLKSLSLTCKTLNDLVFTKIWESVCIKRAEGMKYVQHLPIKYLNLSESGCKDGHLSIISAMSDVRTLEVWGNGDITYAGLSRLANCSQLTQLDISHLLAIVVFEPHL